jgi:Arc/MetJ family transcription regulator
MRVHIHLDDELVSELDRRVGPRGRSGWIEAMMRRSLDDERRWDEIETALGALGSDGGLWGDDPAGRVHAERRADERRLG